MAAIRSYRAASSGQLLRHILERPALVEAVRALPGEVLAKLIEHVGLEDAGEIVALANDEQLARVFDEDLWRAEQVGGDENFQVERFGLWLQVLAEAGDDFVAARLAALEPDLLVHAVHRLVMVLDIDALAAEMAESGEEGAPVEKALESVLYEEWEEFRLIARDANVWDVLWAALVSLDRDHHDRLRRVLEQCAALDAEFIVDNGGLYDVLTSDEMLESDLAADRSDRRAERGHVAPADARAFLKLAASGAGLPERDAITRAYFRTLSRAPTQAKMGASRTASTAEAGAGPLLAALRDAQVLDDNTNVALRLPAGEGGADETGILRSALAALATEHPEIAEQRLEELAYLANVLIAGGAHRGRRPRPIEALEEVVRVCSRGLCSALTDPRFKAEAGRHGASSPETSLLARIEADVLFRLARGTVAGHGET